MENKTINSLHFVILGSGNIAFSLGLGLKDIGLTAKAVIARNQTSGKELAEKLNCVYSNHFADLPACDILFICLPDQHIEAYYNQLPFLPDTIICHSSGMTPLYINNITNQRTGVFYPLQTISKQIQTDWIETPILIESNNHQDANLLLELASKLSKKAVICNSIDRSYYHLSAVFSNNFTNFLLSQALSICNTKGLDSTLLHPIIKKTMVQALATNNTHDLQTGPAIRNDVQTISKHLMLLSDSPMLQQLYDVITKSIQENSHKK